jgi:hypothetical protein
MFGANTSSASTDCRIRAIAKDLIKLIRGDYQGIAFKKPVIIRRVKVNSVMPHRAIPLVITKLTITASGA